MSMYKEYVESRFEGRYVLEFENGFVTYNILSDGILYVDELYIKEEFRRQGLGSQVNKMMDEMAKELGRNKLKCSVIVGAKGSEESLKAIFSYGYKLESVSGKLIFLKKELEKEGE